MDRGLPKQASGLTLETKLGMMTITILVFSFGFLVYRKVDLHQQKLTQASIAPQAELTIGGQALLSSHSPNATGASRTAEPGIEVQGDALDVDPFGQDPSADLQELAVLDYSQINQTARQSDQMQVIGTPLPASSESMAFGGLSEPEQIDEPSQSTRSPALSTRHAEPALAVLAERTHSDNGESNSQLSSSDPSNSEYTFFTEPQTQAEEAGAKVDGPVLPAFGALDFSKVPSADITRSEPSPFDTQETTGVSLDSTADLPHPSVDQATSGDSAASLTALLPVNENSLAPIDSSDPLTDSEANPPEVALGDANSSLVLTPVDEDLLFPQTDVTGEVTSAIGDISSANNSPEPLPSNQESGFDGFPAFGILDVPSLNAADEKSIELAMLAPQPEPQPNAKSQEENPFDGGFESVPSIESQTTVDAVNRASQRAEPQLLFPSTETAQTDSSHAGGELSSQNPFGDNSPVPSTHEQPFAATESITTSQSAAIQSRPAPTMFPSTDPPRRRLSRTADGRFSLAAFNYQNSVDSPVEDSSTYAVTTVEDGDNYTRISRRAYGTIRYFAALAVFNQHRIPDPAKMRPGMKVLTPPAKVLEQRYPELFQDSQPKQAVVASFIVKEDGSAWYRVGERETLSEISEKFLGRSARWIEIYRLNQGLLKDPNKLRPGTILALPDDAVEVNIAP